MPNTWSIKISQNRDGTVTFQPDVPNSHPNQPLGVQQNDTVSWNNTTNQTLTLQSIAPAGLYLTDPIPAGQVSDPMFSVGTIPNNGTSVAYSCVSPSQHRHSIVVVNPSAATS
jgi:hypothetical protein